MNQSKNTIFHFEMIVTTKYSPFSFHLKLDKVCLDKQLKEIIYFDNKKRISLNVGNIIDYIYKCLKGITISKTKSINPEMVDICVLIKKEIKHSENYYSEIVDDKINFNFLQYKKDRPRLISLNKKNKYIRYIKPKFYSNKTIKKLKNFLEEYYEK